MKYTVNRNEPASSNNFHSVAPAVAKLVAGDELEIFPGTYREQITFDMKGSPDAPIQIWGHPGTILRPTWKEMPPYTKTQDLDVYVAESTFDRPVEVSFADWEPIQVYDPDNYSNFKLDKPVPYHQVDSYEKMLANEGTYFQQYFHPFNKKFQLECGYFQYRVSGKHAVIKGIDFQFAHTFQLYNADSIEVTDCSFLCSMFQFYGTKNSQLLHSLVEQVIIRGDEKMLWEKEGEGRAVAMTNECPDNWIDSCKFIKCWNGPAVNGTRCKMTNSLQWGFPNHSGGISGTDCSMDNCTAMNAQDSMFIKGAVNPQVTNCYFEGPVHWREDCSNVFMQGNVFGSSFHVLEESKIGFQSDYNMFLPSEFFRYQFGDGDSAKTLQDCQTRFGQEIHSFYALGVKNYKP